MSQPSLGSVVKDIVRAMAMDMPGVPDGELLTRYLASRDADAFAALVRRHGPMVLGVCRRILPNDYDAEDAFQATFLVLVRKAASVVPKARVGNWLYGVAYQTAVRARSLAFKRRGREVHVAKVPERAERVPPDEWRDIQPLLDRALHALPDRYRVPIVLCDLQGKTRKEAARELGWPEGTVAGRLARGRAALARRLTRQGVTLSVGVMGTLLTESMTSACMPIPLVEATIRAADLMAAGQAAGAISSHVAILMEGVLKVMLLNKIKTALAVMMLIAVAGIGTGGWLYETHAADQGAGGVAPKTQDPGPAPLPQVAPPEAHRKTPLPGDSLPEKPKEPSGLPPISPNPVGGEDVLAVPPQLLPTVPPTPEQLRKRYVQLHEELSHHLTPAQVSQRVQELEKEVAAAKERQQRSLREKRAADELEAVRAMLAKIAGAHNGTAAGAKAQQALQQLTGPLPQDGPVPAVVPAGQATKKGIIDSK
jgi:RNA polymerase sigma factor (sigma-70 family)